MLKHLRIEGILMLASLSFSACLHHHALPALCFPSDIDHNHQAAASLGRQYICPPTITKLSNCYPNKKYLQLDPPSIEYTSITQVTRHQRFIQKIDVTLIQNLSHFYDDLKSNVW